MTPFYGRKAELDSLKLLMRKQAASLVVIRGRRRIGKSRLIREFGECIPHTILSGLPPTTNSSREGQLNLFCDQIAEAFDVPHFRVENWGKAFSYLSQLTLSGAHMLALDEISWMGSKDPDFLGHLKNAWDLHFSRNPNLILILCGSVSSWIEHNILGNTGFVGRISLDLQLKELALSDAALFWRGQKAYTSPSHIFKMLAITGGIPRYLEEIQPHLTPEENIRRLCFEPKGLLYREFDDIFSDLFSRKGPAYLQIMQQLATGPKSISQLQHRTDSSRRMTISEALHDLIKAGFVTEERLWNMQTMKPSRLKTFRMSDNYARFYLQCILPTKTRIKGISPPAYSPRSIPGWDTIVGLQFENLVLSNAIALLPFLHIELNDIAFMGKYVQRPTKRRRECQIDLLIQTHSQVVYLCEVKFHSKPVGMGIYQELAEKRRRLCIPRGWSNRLALLHVNGVCEELIRADLFDFIIDFGSLLAVEGAIHE